MNVVIIGAGRIGRGYVSYLLKLNDIKITYFDKTDFINGLKEKGYYEIHVLGDETKNYVHKDFEAYSIDDIDMLSEKIKESSFVFTSVGGKNMNVIGTVIGKAISKIIECDDKKRNIVTCENWINPAKDLEEAIIQQFDEVQKEKFKKSYGVSESVIVATGTGAPFDKEPDNPFDTWIQDIRYLPVDASRLKGDLPVLYPVEFIDDFGNLLTQKLYTNNTSCTAMSYIGLLYGYKYLCDACNDDYLITVLDELYVEINTALIDGMKINKESQLAFSKRAKQKYTDKNIIDPMTRIARDPIRKLKPTDRFITPARYALQCGCKPWAIARGIAAALFYYQEDDESAGTLQDIRKREGIDYILTDICELDKNEPLFQLIKDEIEWLKKEGLIKNEF